MVGLRLFAVKFFPIGCILKISIIKCWMKSKYLTVKINCSLSYHLKALHLPPVVHVQSLQTLLEQKLAFSWHLDLQKNIFPALFKPTKLSEKVVVQVHIHLFTFQVTNYTFSPICLNSKLSWNKGTTD